MISETPEASFNIDGRNRNWFRLLFFIPFIFLRIIRKIDRYNPDEIKQKGSLILGEATYLHYSRFGHNALSTKAM